MTDKKTDVLLSILPLTPIKYQKQMAAAIKFMELKEILNHYDAVQAQSQTDKNWRVSVVKAMMPKMNEKSREQMKQIMQIMEMQSLMQNVEG